MRSFFIFLPIVPLVYMLSFLEVAGRPDKPRSDYQQIEEDIKGKSFAVYEQYWTNSGIKYSKRMSFGSDKAGCEEEALVAESYYKVPHECLEDRGQWRS